MFDFTLEWSSRRSVAERAIDARTVTERIRFHEALIFPLVLLSAFLFALGTLTGAHLRGQADRAVLFAASAGMGMPMLYPVSELCRRPSRLGSVPRFEQADILALLQKE
jgi:hypothetical protein